MDEGSLRLVLMVERIVLMNAWQEWIFKIGSYSLMGFYVNGVLSYWSPV